MKTFSLSPSLSLSVCARARVCVYLCLLVHVGVRACMCVRVCLWSVIRASIIRVFIGERARICVCGFHLCNVKSISSLQYIKGKKLLD